MTASDAVIVSMASSNLRPRQVFLNKWRAERDNPQSTLVNPYPGLRSFNVDEAHIFRARDTQIKALRKAFAGTSSVEKARHIIIVVGGSSSGKSSVVKAGLLSDIHSLQMPDDGGNWYIAECRPVQAPMQELLSGLATMIVDAIFNELEHYGPKLAEKAEEALEVVGAASIGNASPNDNLRASATRRVRALLDEQLWSTRIQSMPAAMAPYLAVFVREALNLLDAHLHPFRSGPPRLLVSIDQFEEIFRCPDNSEKASLFDLVRFVDRADEQPVSKLYLVASMRSEELHRCSELKGISEIVNRSVHLVELVSRDDVKAAIIEPGRMTLQGYNFPSNNDPNWPYTQASVDAMVDSYDAFASGKVEHRADALPLLQHLLRLLWEKSVGTWVEEESKDTRLLITVESLSVLPGWDETGSASASKRRAPAEDVGEAQNRLARVLNFRADAVYQKAVTAWCNVVGNSSEQTRTLAETVLKAAFVSLVRQDDRRRVVRRWQTIAGMLTISKAAEEFTSAGPIAERRQNETLATLEKPLAAALGQFEQATLIERRADAGSRNDHKLPDQYTVYHESFIRNWRQYANWVREAGKAAATLHAIYKEVNDPTTALAPEEIVTAGREADLSLVIGDLDKEADVLMPMAEESLVPERGTMTQRGWASDAWILGEVSRVELPSARFDARTFLAELNKLRNGAIIARKNHSELEADAATAKAEAAESKAAEARRWIPIAAFGSFLVTTTVIGLGVAVFYYFQNQENWFKHRISGLGLMGFEATEVGVGTVREIAQDRNLWLALNALEPEANADWSAANEEIQNSRDYMMGEIAHRSRRVLADLTFVEDKSRFTGGGTLMPAKCLLKSRTTLVTGPGEPEGPSKIWYRLENGTLQYKASDAAIFQPVDALIDFAPLEEVCISPASEALLVMSARGIEPRPVIALIQWNRATFGRETQWFLQTLPARTLLSWSSSALYTEYPIELSEIKETQFLSHETFVGFAAPVHRRNDLNKNEAKTEQQMGILWTNRAYSSAMIDPSAFKSLDLLTPECTDIMEGRRNCEIKRKMPSRETVSAKYVEFTGKTCADGAEYCRARIEILRTDKKILEFPYQGLRPTGLSLTREKLSIQGSDGVVRMFDLRPKTVRDLIALRWQHLTCALGVNILGKVETNFGPDDALGVYGQPGVPKYFDGHDCKPVNR